MAISLVQEKSGTNSGAVTTVTVTLTSGTTAGNCLVVCWTAIGLTTQPSGVSATLGGSADNFTSAVSSANFGAGILVDPNCAGSQTSVVVTFTGGSGNFAIGAYVYEVSGLAATSVVDKTNSNQTGTTSWTTGATGTLTNANEFIVGLASCYQTTTQTVTGPSSPWTNETAIHPASGSNFLNAISGYQIVSATTTQTYSGTVVASGGNTCVIASLLPASGSTTQGTATLTAAGSLTAAAVETFQETAALTAAASMSAAAVETFQEAATLTAASSMSASAALPTQGAAALTAASGLSAAAVETLRAAAALTAVSSLSASPPVTTPPFPQAPLGTKVELLINGTWTAITSDVYERDNIVITRGHPDESTTAQPTALTATFNNRTGNFSSKNPLGAWYPYFGRNTPIRISVPEQNNYLRIEDDNASYAQAPDSSGLSITGDMDLRLDVTLDNWRTQQLLAGKWADTGNERTWLLTLQENGALTFSFSSNGSGVNAATSTLAVPVPPLRRQSLRITYASSTGTIIFYTSPTIGGSWTQLGTTESFGSSIALFNSTAPVQVGYVSDAASDFPDATGIYGQVHELIIMSGIGGTTKGDANFALATAGASTYTDAQGNVWTAEGTSEISSRKYRGYFELSATPQAWDPTGTDIYSQIQGAGILRRIQQNTQTLGSAFTRAIPSAKGLEGFWPCEDGNTTSAGNTPATPTQFASAVQGVSPGTFTGTPQFASDNSFLCSQALPVINGSRWHFRLPARASADASNIFRFLMHMPSSSDTNNGVIARMQTAGTVARLDLVYGTGGTLTLNGYDSSLNSLFSVGPDAFATDGVPMWVSMELQQSGSSVAYSVVTLLPGATTGSAMSGTLSSATIGNATQFTVNATGAAVLQGTSLGQISYQTIWETLFDFATQLNAYQGEAAGVRFQRLCGEQGVPLRWVGSLDDTVLMGAQTPLSFSDLLQECADADRGQIYEPREALALGYRTRRSMENQQAGMTVNYAAAQLADTMQVTEDDQYTQNDVSITRAYGSGGGTGSSYEAVLASGPLSVQDPPDGVGDYLASSTINLFTDTQLPDEAGWILWVGTVHEPRYPQILVNLARPQIYGTASLFYGIPDLDLGDRLVVVNTPFWLPPDGVTQLANAIAETLNAFVWTIAWCCVPEQPYELAIADDPLYARADSPDSTLHTSISSSATSMSVAAGASGELWTTSGGDFPFDVELGGERITVTNITGSSSPQTFTITRSVNGVVKAQTAGEAVSLFFPSIAAL